MQLLYVQLKPRLLSPDASQGRQLYGVTHIVVACICLGRIVAHAKICWRARSDSYLTLMQNTCPSAFLIWPPKVCYDGPYESHIRASTVFASVCFRHLKPSFLLHQELQHVQQHAKQCVYLPCAGPNCVAAAAVVLAATRLVVAQFAFFIPKSSSKDNPIIVQVGPGASCAVLNQLWLIITAS